MFKEILIPTDGSQGVEEALNCAVSLAKKYDAKLHLVHVVEIPKLQDYGAFFALPNILEELRKSGQEILDKEEEYVRKSGLRNVDTEILEGYPADEILGYAQKNQVDLIVMGTHGRRGLNRVVLGSIAEEVVRRSPVPLLTVRMDGSEKKKR